MYNAEPVLSRDVEPSAAREVSHIAPTGIQSWFQSAIDVDRHYVANAIDHYGRLTVRRTRKCITFERTY